MYYLADFSRKENNKKQSKIGRIIKHALIGGAIGTIGGYAGYRKILKHNNSLRPKNQLSKKLLRPTFYVPVGAGITAGGLHGVITKEDRNR